MRLNQGGEADSGTVPFSCSEDKLVYLDLSFYHEVADKLGAPGEFAQPYVLAHEYGHHVQVLIGTEAAIGDDTIQKEAGRPVDEQGFTHGSSARRQKWCRTGHDTGDPKSCNTFGNTI
jgi:uncharacterized protein